MPSPRTSSRRESKNNFRRHPLAATDEPGKSKESEPTYGELFSDGSIIELIRASKTGQLQMYFSHKNRAAIAPEVENQGRLFRPAALSRSVQRVLALPEKSVDFGSTKNLFAELQRLFCGHGFPPETALTASYFGFATWFADVLPIAPCLLITGPAHEAKLLLDLLACVVRRPLPVSEFTSSVVRSLPMELRPTLLINAGQIRGASLELLRVSNRQDAFFACKGTLVNTYSAKAAYCGLFADTRSIEENALSVVLTPSGNLPVLNPKRKEEIARNIQSKFLAYRTRYIVDVRDSQYDVPEFASVTRMLARVFGAPIVDAPALQTDLVQLLRQHEESIEELAWTDLRFVVLEAVLHHVHVEPGSKIHVGEITDTAMTILKGRNDFSERDPREVGPILKGFGLYSKRDASGYAILLNPDLSRRVHQLARLYAALPRPKRGQCTFCDETPKRGEPCA